MLRLNLGGVWLTLRDYAGVVVEHRGESLCIDVAGPECPHVFYTHNHERHYSGYTGFFYAPFRGNVKIGEAIKTGPFVVTPVEAYNITKLNQGRPIHGRGDGVGYLVEVAGVVIYHMGDTDLIPSLATIKKVDIMLTPIGGDGVMTPEEAAEGVKLIRPKIAVPIHFDKEKLYVKFRDIAHPYAQIINLRW